MTSTEVVDEVNAPAINAPTSIGTFRENIVESFKRWRLLSRAESNGIFCALRQHLGRDTASRRIVLQQALVFLVDHDERWTQQGKHRRTGTDDNTNLASTQLAQVCHRSGGQFTEQSNRMLKRLSDLKGLRRQSNRQNNPDALHTFCEHLHNQRQK